MEEGGDAGPGVVTGVVSLSATFVSIIVNGNAKYSARK